MDTVEPLIERRFWGMNLNGNTAIELDIKSCEIHITSAALNGKSKSQTILKLAMGEQEYTLCSLDDTTPQANLDLTIYPSNEAVFLLVEGESDIDVIGIISVDLNDDGEEEEDVENEDLEEEDMKDEDVEDEEEELEDEDMEDEDLEEEIDDDGMDGDLVDDFLDAEEVDMVDDYLDEDELPQSSVIVEEIKSDEEEEEKKEEKQEEVKETEEKEQEEEKEEEKKPEMTPEEKKREKNRLKRQRQKESKKRRMEKRLEYPVQMINKFTTVKDLVMGTGKLPTYGHKVTVSYSSHLPTGEIIEEDHQVTFRVGIQDINSQLDKAIGTMREGGERKVVIHPEALEDMREEFPSIPKDSKLLFHVKLLKTF